MDNEEETSDMLETVKRKCSGRLGLATQQKQLFTYMHVIYNVNNILVINC